MLYVNIFGVKVCADFSLPAILALMLLLLPQTEVAVTLLSCVLHEAAHFLALAWYHRKPTYLRISCTGMHMAVPRTALCPIGQFAVILLSGIVSNFLAAALFLYTHKSLAAMTNLSLALFNLLPYRSTDGGTLIYALLEHFHTADAPEKINAEWKLLWFSATAVFIAFFSIYRLWSTSLAAMFVFLVISEIMADF